MEIQWESIATSAASATFITGLAKTYIQKIVKELEDVVKDISSTQTQIAILTTRLENAEKTAHLLHDHDRKIAAIEQAIYGNNRKSGDKSYPQ